VPDAFTQFKSANCWNLFGEKRCNQTTFICH